MTLALVTDPTRLTYREAAAALGASCPQDVAQLVVHGLLPVERGADKDADRIPRAALDGLLARPDFGAVLAEAMSWRAWGAR